MDVPSGSELSWGAVQAENEAGKGGGVAFLGCLWVYTREVATYFRWQNDKEEGGDLGGSRRGPLCI